MVIKEPFKIGLICMLGKCSTTELHLQPQGFFLVDTFIDSRSKQTTIPCTIISLNAYLL